MVKIDFPICHRGIMKLRGIGKFRFQTLNQAVRSGADHCPVDQRFTPKGPRLPSEARHIVHDFLMELYLQAAEHIPDGLNSNKRPRQGSFKLDRKGMDRSQMKHLPPGAINDYYVQCIASNPGISISRKLFSSDPSSFNEGIVDLFNICRFFTVSEQG